MKQTKTFIVFRNKETGAYLMEYHSKEATLAFESIWSEDIEDAIYISKEKFEEENERYTGMLQAFGAEPLIVEAEYTLTTLDGKEPEEIKMTTFNDPTDLIAALRNLAKIFAGGDD